MGRVELTRCHFERNENGSLATNGPSVERSIDRCSLAENGAGDGRTHAAYAGTIGRLTVMSSYFAKSPVGHPLKSHALAAVLMYCRLSAEDSTSCDELAILNGGTGVVMGCLIQQGPRSEGVTTISKGVEGYRRPRNEPHLPFNTIVND